MFPTEPKDTQMPPVTTTCYTHAAADTRRLGQELGEEFRGGEIVLLAGVLGAGKSVFANGVGDALGVSSWRGSPTFALVNEYSTQPRLVHVDLYRLSAAEVEELGLEEYAGSRSAMLIEWADRAKDYVASLDSRRLIQVHMDYVEGDTRRLTLIDDVRSPAGAE